MVALKAKRIALQVLILALLGATLTACAGGGGGGGGSPPVVVTPPTPPPPPPPPPPPLPPPPPGSFPSASSTEYQADWAVAGTNAIIAWQNGSTGQGIKIGIIDDGIVAPTDPSYAELNGRVDPASIDIFPGRNQLSSTETHGTEIAAFMVGNFNGLQTVGLAFNATVLSVRADDGSGSFSDSNIAAGINYAVAHGVKVINLSLGKDSPASPTLVQAISNATAAGVIFSISAGNCGLGSAVNSECTGGPATEVNYPGFYASNNAISHGLIMVVGGLNQNGTVNTNSNPPGSNANSYLTAPGWQLIVPDFGPPGPVPGFQTCGLGTNGDLCRVQGTSYASPQLAAAVALLEAAFPGMTPSQIISLLISSADDTGTPGVDSLNGVGRLNIGRAFMPVGNLAVPLTGAAAPIAPDTTLGIAGAAFGDGLRKPGQFMAVGFDFYNRAYAVDLSRNWASANAGPELLVEAPQLWRTAQTQGGVRMSFAPAESMIPESRHDGVSRTDFETPATRIEGEIAPGLSLTFTNKGTPTLPDSAMETEGHLGFVNSQTSLTLTRRLNPFASLTMISQTGEGRVGLMQDWSRRSATAARFSFGPQKLGLDLTYGQIRDEEGLLGLVWSDVLGQTPGGEIRFMGLAGHYQPTPRLRLTAEAESGVADFAHSGFLQNADPIRTSAFSLQAAYAVTPTWLNLFGSRADPSTRGEFTFTISQPLRVEDGTFAVRLPTATNYGLVSLRYQTQYIDPTPSGRELRFGAGYNFYSGDWLSAFGEMLYVTEPGHIAYAPPEGVMRFGFRVRN